MTSPDLSPLRILIGAASFADARAALRLARLLAARAPAQVGGLLVEEVGLGDLPRLGRQRIVTASGALRDMPTPGEIARLVERDARDFAAALAELAGAAGPLVRRQGELTPTLLQVETAWDVLVFGQRETHGLRGRVVLIVPPAGAPHQAAELAEDLARAAGTRTLALGLAGDGGAGADDVCADEAALVARIGRLNCTAVVLDVRAGPIRSLDALRAVVAAARCPVVVVGRPSVPDRAAG